MATAYVDTSVLLAIEFREAGAEALTDRLESFDTLQSANLLEAEFRAALRREGRPYDPVRLRRISWIMPDRRLDTEIHRVLEAAPVRGADCWHLAVALAFTENPRTMTFLTLDQRQAAAARALGFRI